MHVNRAVPACSSALVEIQLKQLQNVMRAECCWFKGFALVTLRYSQSGHIVVTQRVSQIRESDPVFSPESANENMSLLARH